MEDHETLNLHIRLQAIWLMTLIRTPDQEYIHRDSLYPKIDFCLNFGILQKNPTEQSD